LINSDEGISDCWGAEVVSRLPFHVLFFLSLFYFIRAFICENLSEKKECNLLSVCSYLVNVGPFKWLVWSPMVLGWVSFTYLLACFLKLIFRAWREWYDKDEAGTCMPDWVFLCWLKPVNWFSLVQYIRAVTLKFIGHGSGIRCECVLFLQQRE